MPNWRATAHVWASATLMASLAWAGDPTPRAESSRGSTEESPDLPEAEKYTQKTLSPDNPIDTGGASIVIAAPIAEVRKAVLDYRHYKDMVRGFDQSQILSRKKNATEVYLQIPVLHGAAKIWGVIKMVGPEKVGDEELVVGHLIKGNVDEFRARFRLRSVDANTTVLKLEVLVDPTFPIPNDALTGILSRAAARGVTGIRDHLLKSASAKATAKEGAKGSPAKTNSGHTDAGGSSTIATR